MYNNNNNIININDNNKIFRPELTIIYFWEIYTKQIEDDKVLRDLWQTIISFIKDVLQQGNSNKILFYSLLRLVNNH